MFGNGDGRILRDVAGNLLGALLYDETAETTEIHVVFVGQRRLDAIHESLNVACTCTFSTPVLLAISLTISAFVISI